MSLEGRRTNAGLLLFHRANRTIEGAGGIDRGFTPLHDSHSRGYESASGADRCLTLFGQRSRSSRFADTGASAEITKLQVMPDFIDPLIESPRTVGLRGLRREGGASLRRFGDPVIQVAGLMIAAELAQRRFV